MEQLDGRNTAVYSANSFSDYGHSLLRDPETTPKFAATGCDPCMLANRISYFFNLKGPSVTIDTACSSSITALHLACQSLRTGESSHAIVSACHLNISPDTTVSYSLSQ
jgi:acyl transferase domain-containing protein